MRSLIERHTRRVLLGAQLLRFDAMAEAIWPLKGYFVVQKPTHRLSMSLRTILTSSNNERLPLEDIHLIVRLRQRPRLGDLNAGEWYEGEHTQHRSLQPGMLERLLRPSRSAISCA